MRNLVRVPLSEWRHPVVLFLVVLLPVSAFAQDTGGAIVHTNGAGVLVNNSAAPASTAVFPNDLIETKKGAFARLQANGSSVDINSETMVQFASEELVLDHGILSVNTSRGLGVRVGCVTVTTVNPSDWTQYEVMDVDGKVTVHSLKNDVYIDSRSNNPRDVKKSSHSTRDLVRESQQKSREEKCGGALKGDARPGLGAVMNSGKAQIAGIAMVVAVTCLGVCRPDDPISPHQPQQQKPPTPLPLP